MRQIRFQYRTVIQTALAIGLVAFPLIAYAKLDAAPTRVDATSAPAATAQTAQVIDPAAVTSQCDAENWPFYSAGCVRGRSNTMQPRQIALVTTDAPLVSMPRVITAPTTSRTVVTHDTRVADVRPKEQRRRVAIRQESRMTFARSEPAAASAMPAPDRILAGW